jgi:hypothetical protein
MPVERRQILLSDEELTHAVEAYRGVNPGFLPQGDLLQVKVGPGAGDHAAGAVAVAITIRMCYGQSQQEVDVPIREIDVMHLLIRFCLENNIPIPRLGTKSAALIDGTLALQIEYDHAAVFTGA